MLVRVFECMSRSVDFVGRVVIVFCLMLVSFMLNGMKDRLELCLNVCVMLWCCLLEWWIVVFLVGWLLLFVIVFFWLFRLMDVELVVGGCIYI